MVQKIKKIAALIMVSCLLVSMAVPVHAADGRVNINTAGKEELMTLKYIGDKLADRIIEYRTTTPFKVPEDIMNVKGVGQKVFDANKDRICCDG